MFTITYNYNLYGVPEVVTKSHIINVEELNIDLEPVTNELQLYLTSNGRSNNETNPAT